MTKVFHSMFEDLWGHMYDSSSCTTIAKRKGGGTERSLACIRNAPSSSFPVVSPLSFTL